MNAQLDEAHLSVEKAREALRNGDRTEARQWAEHAASLAPQMEDPWLILAAVASPRASVEYIKTALRINPGSERARRGMEWATQRLRAASAPEDNLRPGSIADKAAPAQAPKRSEGRPASKRNLLFPILLVGVGCIICAAVAWSAGSAPVLAYLMNGPAPVAAHPQVWAQANIPKPTHTPFSLAESQATPTPQLFLQPTLEPTEMAAPAATNLPVSKPQPTALPANTSVPSPQNTAAPLPATPTYSGSISMSIVADTPTAEISTNVPPATPESTSEPQAQPQVASTGVRWIDVNLTQQMVYAYQGNSVVNSFLVSTGTWQYPTVTGQYHIYVKLLSTDMTGPGYYLPNVPYTMYFYEGYGLHGTYWHHNFGTPMSHGCVNLSIPDAEWLYDWASVGTLVNVHY
ncbi:MAG TPA: L,D-transpeptidase family protein [Anaerolineales bacterium]|nr:L,D-transpeptidase family protein [Anaerolineales bacterium]